MNDQKVSIILPVYNVEKYIEHCISSILAQTYTNFELIIVDDGCQDNSIVVAQEYAKSDKRIKILHKENGGLSDARNFGLKYATGNYIQFIDSDDYVEKNLISDTLELALKNDSDIVIFGYYVDTENKNEILISRESVSEKNQNFNKKSLDNSSINLSSDNLIGYAWNKLYKASIIFNNNTEFAKGISFVEDILFNADVIRNSNKITFSDKLLYHYMQRPRDTLGKKFYDNGFELAILSVNALSIILKEFKYCKADIEEIENRKFFNYVRFNINLLNNNTAISGKEKIKRISDIVSKFKKTATLENIKITGVINLFYIFMFKYNYILLLYLVENLLKFRRKIKISIGNFKK